MDGAQAGATPPALLAVSSLYLPTRCLYTLAKGMPAGQTEAPKPRQEATMPKKKAVQPQPERSVSDRMHDYSDDWAPMPRAEWINRLRNAKVRASEILANAGLDVDRDDYMPCEEFWPGGVGDSLSPDLLEARKYFMELIDTAAATLGDKVEGIDDDVLNHFIIKLTESAYLFGVIAGSQVPWSVIEAIAPPRAPAAKGGVR
jgi:hypothetical protein